MDSPRHDQLRTSSLVILLVAGCFDPEIGNVPDESSGTGGSESVETTLETSASTTPTTTTTATTADTTIDPSETDPDDSGTTMPPPECEGDGDCPAAAECFVATCEDGTCVEAPADAGTACGDDRVAECNGADSCDGKGTCVDNVSPDGAACTGCALGQCSCTAGACGDCTFAPANNFVTARAIEGWELTGGWALYRAAPQSRRGPEVLFEGQVLGTDGNRSQPYPGGELEDSHARTTATTLPATLDFLSWHVDEGGGGSYDNKSIAVSVDDGVTWIVVASCMLDPTLPFCVSLQERAPDAWDPISIALPPELVGQRGLVEFRYTTGDDCCDFERGWYVDVLGFAGECACGEDAACDPFANECGAGSCGVSGECELTAVAADTACGDGTEVECNAADACDGVGYCLPRTEATGLAFCHDCPSGDACALCQSGECNDCATATPTNDFSFELATFGWVTETLDGTGNDWRLYFQAPPRAVAGSLPINFPNAPVWGTDGNRVQPYDVAVPPNNAHVENSQFTTSPDVVPDAITFDSWHVDEGGTGSYDRKTIELSVDDGMSFVVLLDCQTADSVAYPFCAYRDDDRPGDVWDPITIDTAAYAGMVGRLRFTYRTTDAAGTFERGWYIDNLSFAQSCNDPQFP